MERLVFGVYKNRLEELRSDQYLDIEDNPAMNLVDERPEPVMKKETESSEPGESATVSDDENVPRKGDWKPTLSIALRTSCEL